MAASARQQLPAYSPLSSRALVKALVSRLASHRDLRVAAAEFVAAKYDADRAILVDSGCGALQMAIVAAMSGPGAGSAVAIPAFSCFEVATAAVGSGSPIALYDLRPESMSPDLGSLEAILRRGVRTVVVAPLYGVPVDWDELSRLAAQYDALLIEDAAQGHGGSWNGKALGTLGTMSVLSFGRGKGWTAGGGGGLLLRGSAKSLIAQPHLRSMSSGREARIAAAAMLQWGVGRPSLYGVPASIPGLQLGQTRYHAPAAPRLMAAFSLALASQTHAASSGEADQRKKNAAWWVTELPEHARTWLPRIPSAGVGGYIRFPVQIPGGSHRLLKVAGARRHGIAPSYPNPLGSLRPVAERLLEGLGEFPGATVLARELTTLPTHSLLTEIDRRAILAILGSLYP